MWIFNNDCFLYSNLFITFFPNTAIEIVTFERKKKGTFSPCYAVILLSHITKIIFLGPSGEHRNGNQH